MSTHAAAGRLPKAPHGHSEPAPHHPVKYVMIFLMLVILTAVTLLISFYRFNNELVNVLLALIVATAKAALVALFFMHLKFEGKLIKAMLLVPVGLTIMLVVTLIPDIYMTNPIRNAASSSMHLFNPDSDLFHGFGK